MGLDEKLYWFAQRHYWLSPLLDRVRWWLERLRDRREKYRPAGSW